MKQAKKLSFYEVNPRYFKDDSGNGVGDLIGLANKFDYFSHINVSAIILQDILSTDSSKEKSKSFTTVASDIGDIDAIIKIISLAKKAKKKILIELNIGSVAENHNWFKSAEDQEVKDYKEVIDFKSKKVHDSIEYKYSSENKKYYAIDSNTQEVQLNWGNDQVIDNFMKVIRFWIDLGIGGFVFKNFEYVAEEDQKAVMSKKTLKELRKFYRAIKEINDNVLVIGKTDFLPLAMASHYTGGATKVFDYFLSTEISKIGLHPKFHQDAIGRFSPRVLAKTLKNYAYSSNNIVSLNSSHLGKAISRWLNDMQFIRESAKTLGTLLIFNKASSSIYFGDEIGAPNIGLTHLDDFQDHTIEKRKSISLQSKLSEKEFMEAQVSQGAINGRALMAWSSEKNGGFSVAEKTITPVSSRYKEINVTNQFKNPTSVLNFYAQLNKIAHNSLYSSIIENGKQKISTPMIGVIKNRIIYETKELIIFANLTNSKKSILLRPKLGKVILSSYDLRDYNEVPKTLDAYETIVIFKDANEFSGEAQLLKSGKSKVKESTKKEEKEIQTKEEQIETKLIKSKEKEHQNNEVEKTKIMKLKAQEKVDKKQRKENTKQARELEKTRKIELKAQESVALKMQKDKTLKEVKIQDNESIRNKTHELEAVLKKDNIEKKSKDKVFKKEENKVETKDHDSENMTKKIKKPKEKNIDDGNMFDFEEDLNDPSLKEQAHELKVEDMSSEQKSEIDIAKANAKLEKNAEDSYKDEATKLKEEEIAKTTLVDDSFDIDELFGDENNKKDK